MVCEERIMENISYVIRETTILLSGICGFIATIRMGISGAIIFVTAYLLGWISLWSIIEERKQ